MDARIRAMARKCKNRGGDCPCVVGCEAIKAIGTAMESLAREERKLQDKRERLENQLRRLNTPPAKLRDGFKFDPRYQPVMVFDCGEAHFGYEDENGEWIDSEEWPFDPSVEFIWEATASDTESESNDRRTLTGSHRRPDGKNGVSIIFQNNC